MQGLPERSSARYWEEVYSGGGEGTDLAGTRLEQGLAEVIGDVADRRVLDLGCGEGHLAVWLASRGASVVAIDRAATAVSTTARNARASGVSDRVEVRVADALELDGPEDGFDLVVGRFVLHHMEPFGVFVDQLATVVAENGRAVFYENSAANPVLNFARLRVAGRWGVPRYGDDDERPLDGVHLAECARRFSVTLHHPTFVFFSLANVYLVRGRSARLHGMNRRLDRLLGRIPAIRRRSYHQIVELRPRV